LPQQLSSSKTAIPTQPLDQPQKPSDLEKERFDRTVELTTDSSFVSPARILDGLHKEI
jgi:hypothetical protein